MTVLDGMSHAEFEKLVGEKVPAKVLFFLRGEKLYFRQGERWFEGSA